LNYFIVKDFKFRNLQYAQLGAQETGVPELEALKSEEKFIGDLVGDFFGILS